MIPTLFLRIEYICALKKNWKKIYQNTEFIAGFNFFFSLLLTAQQFFPAMNVYCFYNKNCLFF